MRCELELNNCTASDKNTVIATLVNSGYTVKWGKKIDGKTRKKVLVVRDCEEDKINEL